MKKTRKSLIILMAAAMVLIVTSALAFGAGDSGSRVKRIAGANRYDTSAKTALNAYPNGAETVIVARGDNEGQFADGLAASYLAGLKNAPILLTDPKDLPQEIEDAIVKLKAKRAYVLGGKAAISETVESKLKGLDLEVKRIEGNNRYATAVSITAEGGHADTALVVSGFAPADSLAAGPLASSKGYPILLVSKDSVPDETKKAIADLGINNIIVIGGEGVISKGVYGDLKAKERYSGHSRIETSLDVAEKCFKTSKNFSIVGYMNLADAVGAAVYGNPIIYVKDNLAGVQSYLAGVVTADIRFTIFGGSSAVNGTVENALRKLLGEPVKPEIPESDDFVIIDGVLTEYNGSGGNIAIPDSVKSIGDKAFYSCDTLTSVIIPDSVTSIGKEAFACCHSLTNVNIPDSVTSLGNGAFLYCSRLESVTIGNGVMSIGNYSFHNCGKLANVTIGDSVKSIGDETFSHCLSLKSVTIPDSVTSIGNEAFLGCEWLTSVIIPDGVTSLGNGAFFYCSRLESVTIGNGVTSIGNEAFLGCDSLTSVIIGNNVKSIGDEAFRYCNKMKSVIIPNGVTSIGNYAFSDCGWLESVTIPASVTNIGNETFGGYYGFGNLTIYGVPGSYAETHAKKYGIPFLPM
jgi:putative cell wall-binding protein